MALPELFERTKRPLILSDPTAKGHLELLTVLPGAETTLAFTMEQQVAVFWCWAAVAVSVLRFLRGEFKTQCELATDVFNGALDCCGNQEPCDRVKPLELALSRAGVFAGKVGVLNPQAVQTQIEAQRPLGCAIRWFADNTAHFVVIYGFSLDFDGTPWVRVGDPKYGDWEGEYATFRTAYLDGAGGWVASYLTA